MKEKLILVLKFSFAAAIITWLVRSDKIDFSVFSVILKPQYLLPSIALTVLSFYFISERWRVLMASRGIFKTRFETLKLTSISVFFSFLLPGGLSGDVVKAWYITRSERDKMNTAVMSVIMDRIFGFFCLLFMSFFAMLFNFKTVLSDPNLKAVFFMLFFIFVSSIALFVMLYFGKFHEMQILNGPLTDKPKKRQRLLKRVRQLLEAAHLLVKDPLVLAKAGFLSFMAQVTCISVLCIVGYAMKVDVHWSAYFFVAPIGFILMALPIAPAGIGVGQAAFYFLFNLYIGKPSDLGPTAITVFQVLVFCFGLFGAYFYLRQKGGVHVTPGDEKGLNAY